MEAEEGVPVQEAWDPATIIQWRVCGRDTLLGLENSTSVASNDIIKREGGRNMHTAATIMASY